MKRRGGCINNEKDAPPSRILRSSKRLAAVHIDDLPLEVLALCIFQLLPWQDRLHLELVSRGWRQLVLAQGWSDVRHLDEDNFKPKFYNRSTEFNHSPWRGPLLTRIGPYLTSIKFHYGEEESDDVQTLRRDLAKCPNLEHLSFNSTWIDPSIVEHIRRKYASKLKSLVLDDSLPSHPLVVFNEALGKFSSLEYLRVREDGENMGWLRFTASTLPNLRVLSLEALGTKRGAALSHSKNLEVLASLPHLHSLELRHTCLPMKDFSFLQHFPKLGALSLAVAESNLGSLVAVLSHLTHGNLRALEISTCGETKFASIVEKLSDTIAAKLPKLEHLGLLRSSSGEEEDEADYELEKMADERAMLFLLPLVAMQWLLSLELHLSFARGADWCWLEDMHQLEYLRLPERPPLPTLFKLIRNCKSLHAIEFGEDCRLAKHEREALREELSQLDKKGQESNSKQQPQPKRPTLHVRIDDAHSFNCEEWERCELGLHFIKNGLRSHILHRHKYGCLNPGCHILTR